MLEIFALVISILSLVFSVITYYDNRRIKMREEAISLFIGERVLKEKEFEEYKSIHYNKETHSMDSIPVGVTLNCISNKPFNDVFIIAVQDITYDSDDIKNLEASILNKYYIYLSNVIKTQENLIVPTGGGGMSKKTGFVLMYTDSNGNQWLKMPNNKLYSTDNYIDKLMSIGLPNPDYKFNN